MNIKTLNIVLLVFLSLNASSRNLIDTSDYWQYHKLIYQAEIAFFDKGDADSCLYYYDKAFDSFDFNYVHDLVNAAQIAHYVHCDYDKYLRKGIVFGLRPAHLEKISAWHDSPIIKEFADFENSNEGKMLRQKYLQSINTDYLQWIYDFCLTEIKHRRNINSNGEAYQEMFAEWTPLLQEKISTYGYPGQRLIGISDSLLYKELNIEGLNFNKKVEESKDSICKIYYQDTMFFPDGSTMVLDLDAPTYICFELDYSKMSQNLSQIFSVHHPCPMHYLSSIYRTEIQKGNLHPREYAFSYDGQVYTNKEETCSCCADYVNDRIFYRIGNDNTMWNISRFVDDGTTDRMRAELWIAPLRVDKAKKNFEELHGYHFIWGLDGCL